MTDEKALEKISNIVGTFLMEKGGFANGYCTCATGVIEYGPNIISTHMRVEVNNRDLTSRQLDNYGEELANLIVKFMKTNEVHARIIITKRDHEYGCRTTYVQMIKEAEVYLDYRIKQKKDATSKSKIKKAKTKTH